jgi:hypothetical protein
MVINPEKKCFFLLIIGPQTFFFFKIVVYRIPHALPSDTIKKNQAIVQGKKKRKKTGN